MTPYEANQFYSRPIMQKLSYIADFNSEGYVRVLRLKEGNALV